LLWSHYPDNIDYINHTKEENGFKFEVVGKAVDDSQDKIKTFYFPVAKNSSKLATSASLINSFSGTKGIFNNLPYETVEVPTTTLTSLIEPFSDSCLIKLDCEGNELSILESSISVLAKDDVFKVIKEHGYEGYLITNAGLVSEDRQLTFPYPERKNRTIWKNHFFTKKGISEIKSCSEKNYGYWI
jgi:FkbM family methyltransferase